MIRDVVTVSGYASLEVQPISSLKKIDWYAYQLLITVNWRYNRSKMYSGLS